MIAPEKLQAFVAKATAMGTPGRLAPASPGADPSGSLYSDQVFTQLQWPPEDVRYFQEDADNLVRELEYQGVVVIWDEHRRATVPADPAWMVYTFTLTEKGRRQGRGAE